MICPQCGNVITLQEYKCSKCGVDLHCNTPEERQKREEYANQMYASGQWRVPELKTVQSVVNTDDRTVKYKEDKPKSRKPFIISTIVLGILCVILIIGMKMTVDDLSDKIAENIILRIQISDHTEDMELHNLAVAYELEANSDYSALETLFTVFGNITLTDMDSSLDSIHTTYTGYTDLLKTVQKFNSTGEYGIDTINNARESWKNGVNEVYSTLIESSEKMGDAWRTATDG